MYRVTIKISYYDVHFKFNDMTQASNFAWECVEQAENNITVTLSKITEENEDE